MQTTYKRFLVYDLETGGLKSEFNSITEIAIVSVDAITLEIIEEFSVMIKPYIDLSFMDDDPVKESKMLYKNISEKDEDGSKYLTFKGERFTIATAVDAIQEPVRDFYKFIVDNYPSKFLKLTDILKILKDPTHKDVMKMYFNNAYNPEALSVTKINTGMLVSEGVECEEAFESVLQMVQRHKVGNSKPVICGHNIGTLPRRIVLGKEKKPDGFDNPFMEKFFSQNKADWFNSVNELILDTLKMARLRWVELPNYSLGTCANELGLTLKEAHRALPDTIANAKVLIKMLRFFRSNGEGQEKNERKKFNLNY
jgi:DNA polymerase III epsilon subunit-like protein